jgi:SulP family sulfate permease
VQDFALVALILATAATVGFLQAVAVGLLAAALLFVLAYSRLEVVRASATAALRHSTTERPEAAARRLAERGAETLVVELQGYVFFGTAHALHERLVRAIDAADGPLRRVILDFRRVQGLDVSALHSFGKLEQLARTRGVELILADPAPQVRAALAQAGLLDRLRDFPTLDAALAAVEDEVLAEEAQTAEPEPTLVARLVTRLEADGTTTPAAETIAAGTELMRQGDPADDLVLLEAGLLSARVAGDDGRATTVASFLPGTVVGEIALYAGGRRTATVVAEVESRIRRISRDHLAAIAARDPALARDVHAAIAALLARRLARTTALLHEMSR